MDFPKAPAGKIITKHCTVEKQPWNMPENMPLKTRDEIETWLRRSVLHEGALYILKTDIYQRTDALNSLVQWMRKQHISCEKAALYGAFFKLPIVSGEDDLAKMGVPVIAKTGEFKPESLYSAILLQPVEEEGGVVYDQNPSVPALTRVAENNPVRRVTYSQHQGNLPVKAQAPLQGMDQYEASASPRTLPVDIPKDIERDLRQCFLVAANERYMLMPANQQQRGYQALGRVMKWLGDNFIAFLDGYPDDDTFRKYAISVCVGEKNLEALGVPVIKAAAGGYMQLRLLFQQLENNPSAAQEVLKLHPREGTLSSPTRKPLTLHEELEDEELWDNYENTPPRGR